MSLFKKRNKTVELGRPSWEVPGGAYPGVMCVPGDSNREWVKGDKYEKCRACGKGWLTYYWQDEYYRMQCDNCNFLNDSGRKLTESEKAEMVFSTVANLPDTEINWDGRDSEDI